MLGFFLHLRRAQERGPLPPAPPPPRLAASLLQRVGFFDVVVVFVFCFLKSWNDKHTFHPSTEIFYFKKYLNFHFSRSHEAMGTAGCSRTPVCAPFSFFFFLGRHPPLWGSGRARGKVFANALWEMLCPWVDSRNGRGRLRAPFRSVWLGPMRPGDILLLSRGRRTPLSLLLSALPREDP